MTYRHYWTEDVSSRVNAVLERSADERLDAMRAELRALERRIEATQRDLDRRTTAAARPGPDASHPCDAALRAAASGSVFDAALRAAVATPA